MEDETIRVLLVDDDQGDFEMTRAMIAEIDTRSIELDWVSTYEEGIDALEDGAHDVYLIDYVLEDRSGVDLLREARERSVRAPLIMLTGRGNRRVYAGAMEAGAADYLVKGRIDPEILERSIRFALQRSRTERALRENENRFRTVFRVSGTPMALLGLHGSVLDVNPAFQHTLGLASRGSAVGQPFPDAVGDEDRSELLDALRSVAAGERPTVVSHRRLRGRDGERLDAQAKISSVPDAAGAPDHLLVLLEGVSGVEDA